MTLPFMLRLALMGVEVAEFGEVAEFDGFALILAGRPDSACTSACNGGRNTLKPGLRFDPLTAESRLVWGLNRPRNFELGLLNTLNLLMRKAPGR